MKYILIGVAVSCGWHVGKLLYRFAEEVLFNRLHATEWYAVLCKKQEAPVVQMKPSGKTSEDYKETKMGFLKKSA